MGNWNVDVDTAKNRLYLTLGGKLSEREAAAAADATIEGAERLDAGFEMVNDISEFKPSGKPVDEQIKRGKVGVARNGVDAVVRVVPESTTGEMQWDRAGGGSETYQLAKADSAEQAEKLLESRS
jgi:hypothetical protein